jgi:hypothetical protein
MTTAPKKSKRKKHSTEPLDIPQMPQGYTFFGRCEGTTQEYMKERFLRLKEKAIRRAERFRRRLERTRRQQAG